MLAYTHSFIMGQLQQEQRSAVQHCSLVLGLAPCLFPPPAGAEPAPVLRNSNMIVRIPFPSRLMSREVQVILPCEQEAIPDPNDDSNRPCAPHLSHDSFFLLFLHDPRSAMSENAGVLDRVHEFHVPSDLPLSVRAYKMSELALRTLRDESLELGAQRDHALMEPAYFLVRQ
ncbi:hypothetical protein CALCODRAFT_188641 [Calocera cornea HHB12733]|uniref:Uncharacterized protein n=1 Tax=Calocera cornea HHB12733 TaxID=1353952 RepID=A0A165C9E9_9BASI|nr:hypothetical protein CALCODRAFT_188641 [Calocera cornea HHB12733]